MQVIALVSQKGGCGKTTLAECLAVAAAREGLVTAIIDLSARAVRRIRAISPPLPF